VDYGGNQDFIFLQAINDAVAIDNQLSHILVVKILELCGQRVEIARES